MISSISGGIACLRPRVSRDITRRRVRHFTWKFALTPEGLCRNKSATWKKRRRGEKSESGSERERGKIGNEEEKVRERKEAANIWEGNALSVQGACTDFRAHLSLSLSNLPLPPSSTIAISPSFSLSLSLSLHRSSHPFSLSLPYNRH